MIQIDIVKYLVLSHVLWYLVISCHVIIHDAPCGTVRNGAERCGTVRPARAISSDISPGCWGPAFAPAPDTQPQLPRSRAAAQLLRSSWVLMALGRSCLFAMTSSTASFNQQFLAVSQNVDPNPQIQWISDKSTFVSPFSGPLMSNGPLCFHGSSGPSSRPSEAFSWAPPAPRLCALDHCCRWPQALSSLQQPQLVRFERGQVWGAGEDEPICVPWDQKFGSLHEVCLWNLHRIGAESTKHDTSKNEAPDLSPSCW